MVETMLREELSGREVAEAFHGTLIAALAEWIGAEASARNFARVALGGGCLINRVLAEGLMEALRASGLDAGSPARGSRKRRGALVRTSCVRARSGSRRRRLDGGMTHVPCDSWWRCAKCCRTRWPRSASTA